MNSISKRSKQNSPISTNRVINLRTSKLSTSDGI